jgi:hypothetical protein
MSESERKGLQHARRVSDEAWERLSNGPAWVVTNALDLGSGDGAYNERGHYEEMQPDGRLAVVNITPEGIIVDWFRDGEPDDTWAVDWDEIADPSA